MARNIFNFLQIKTPVVLTFPQTSQKIYSSLCFIKSHKNSYLSSSICNPRPHRLKMNSNFYTQNLRGRGLYNKRLQSITEQLFIISKGYYSSIIEQELMYGRVSTLMSTYHTCTCQHLSL